MLKWKNENNIKIINEINLICSNDLELLKESCLDKILDILTTKEHNENENNSNNSKTVNNDNNIDRISRKYNLDNNNILKNKLLKKDELQISKEIDIYYENKVVFSGSEITKDINIFDEFFEILLTKDNMNYENISLKINDFKDLNYLFQIFEFLQNKKYEINKNYEEIDNYIILKKYDELLSSFNSKNEYSCFFCRKKIKKKYC